MSESKYWRLEKRKERARKKEMIKFQKEHSNYWYTMHIPIWGETRISPIFSSKKQGKIWLKRYREGKVKEIS